MYIIGFNCLFCFSDTEHDAFSTSRGSATGAFMCIYLLLGFADTKCDFLCCNRGSVTGASNAFSCAFTCFWVLQTPKVIFFAVTWAVQLVQVMLFHVHLLALLLLELIFLFLLFLTQIVNHTESKLQ